MPGVVAKAENQEDQHQYKCNDKLVLGSKNFVIDTSG